MMLIDTGVLSWLFVLSSVVLLEPVAVQGACNSYVIVGAGISGLSAAKKLIDSGVPGSAVRVIEARNRTGGRVFTDTTSLGVDAKVELGAAWIHGGGAENPIRQLSDKFSGTTLEADDVVEESFTKEGTFMSTEEQAQAANRADVNFLGSRFGGPSRSFRDSVNRKFKQQESASQVWLARREFDTAGPDSSWSAQHLMGTGESYDGPELIFKDGYSAVIIDNLVAELQTAGVTLSLSSEVTRVSHSSSKCGGVVLDVSGSSQVTAEAAIVTVPLGVLKANRMTFSPSLPSAHTGALDRLRMGNCGKAFARFSSDFWSDTIGQNTFIFSVEIPNADDSTRGRHYQFFNLQRDFGVPILHSFFSGDYADAADQKTDSEVLADFMTSLRIAFPNAPTPISFLRTNWGADQFALGSYTTWAGTTRYYPEDWETLATAVSASLYLAGEHTNQFVSSVHGAYLSGQHAAEKLL